MSKRYLVTIGTFDGVHRGHAKLLQWSRARAKSLKLKTRVVFFVMPPRFHFQPKAAVPTLTCSQERKTLIRDLGIDQVEILTFGPRWAKMGHVKFFEDYIVKRWKAGGLLVGRDFAFGKGRKGDLAYMKKACKERKMSFGVFPLVRVGGKKISSSTIRDLLLKGQVAKAEKLLGRPYALTGKVVRGQGIGRTLGIPTANLRLPSDLLLPTGVFKVKVRCAGMRTPRIGVCNAGVRPTVSKKGSARLEVHLPGWKKSLYGRRLTIEFVQKIRAEKKFKNLEALKRAIQKDIASL